MVKRESFRGYEIAITNERIRNGKSMGIASGPVSGIKQRFLDRYSKNGIKQSLSSRIQKGVYLYDVR